jgi:hypothetical protein
MEVNLLILYMKGIKAKHKVYTHSCKTKTKLNIVFSGENVNFRALLAVRKCTFLKYLPSIIEF